MGTVATVVLALALIATYLTWTASRMDRLHARTDAARAALDAQLVRRAATALEVAASHGIEPLRAAASAGYHSEQDARAAAETALSEAMRSVRLDEESATALAEAGRRVVLARTFYNDAVRDTVAFRQRRVVRALRLVGHAPEPEPFEIDDTPPADTPLADTPLKPDAPVSPRVVT
ncbi:MAG: hypothetical protein QOJ92_2754 [Frankiales bacterium]|nr:hypothetical protein [Frankiales bacterium]